MFNAVEVEVETLEMRILDFGGCREDDASLKRLYFRISCRRRELGTRAAACGAHDPGGFSLKVPAIRVGCTRDRSRSLSGLAQSSQVKEVKSNGSMFDKDNRPDGG